MTEYQELSEAQRQLIAEIDVQEASVKRLISKLINMHGPDPRNVLLGRTHSEDSFMRLRRAVATGLSAATYEMKDVI